MPFPLKLPTHLPTHPPLWVVTELQSWVPCVIQEIPSGYLLYMWQCICFNATLSNHPTYSLPHCVQNSVLYVCISTAAL